MAAERLNKRLWPRLIKNSLTFVCTWKVIKLPQGAKEDTHFEVKLFLIIFSDVNSATVWMGGKQAEFVIMLQSLNVTFF